MWFDDLISVAVLVPVMANSERRRRSRFSLLRPEIYITDFQTETLNTFFYVPQKV